MKPLADGVFTRAAPLALLGAEMGTRMTVLQVGDGLILYSPVKVDDALAAEIDQLGEVRWIVAPNLFHHLYARRAKERWPDAELLVAPGLLEKSQRLTGGQVLDAASPPEAWRGVVDVHLVGGMPKLNELVLYHRDARALVVCDFLFNLNEGGGWTRTFLSIMGAYGGPRQSRLLRSVMRDKDAVRASRDIMLGWDFDALSLTHGDTLEAGGKDALASASAWLG